MIIDSDIIDSLRLIHQRYEQENKRSGRVFILMSDFPWYKRRNGQLDRLFHLGYILKPLFSSNGADITLTEEGWHFFDRLEVPGMTLSTEKKYEMLVALKDKMDVEPGDFGFEGKATYRAIKLLQDEGYIADGAFAVSGCDPTPQIVWLGKAYVTEKGFDFLEKYSRKNSDEDIIIDLTHEMITACAKIADGIASYKDFDENGYNRLIRDYLDAGLSRFGYSICDQTEQGLGKTDKKPGELDIRINKTGIPVAIFEGLIHKDEPYLYKHIDKAVGRYNQSGCKTVYVVEYSKNVRFDDFWENAVISIEKKPEVNGVQLFETNLMGVKALKAKHDWNGEQIDLIYLGVNCYWKG